MSEILPFVHEGLGNSSYLVHSGNGTAIAVDPDRSVARYLAAADTKGWRIATVLETHLHADFVSGASELRAATGAELFVPEGGEVKFPHRPVTASDRLRLGSLSIETVPSPGHTPEHVSYVIRTDGRQPALFSGGSLIVGGAARTDLIAPDRTELLTRAQFRSITAAFKGLPDETLLLPTHGGGSFCSTGSAGSRTSTLGAERRTNPLLAHTNEDEFAAWFPTTFPAAPRYFFRMRPLNQRGPTLRRDIQLPPRLGPDEFNHASGSALVVDVRPQAEFMAGHVPGALSNTFRDAFATWLGWVVPQNTPLLFVLGEDPLARVLDECLLVGYERFAGVLDGGMDAWVSAGRPISHAPLLDAQRSRKRLQEGALALDVREANEFAAGHIPGALHVPLGELAERASELPWDRPVITYCGHGERSATALSILERMGHADLANFDGGFGAWEDAGMEVEQ